jgi:nucleoside-diphosphate-sugar epimerase
MAGTVLVTGAAGVVGRAVLAALPGHRRIGLVHADAEAPEADRLLTGDLRRPRLGLGAEEWDRLAAEVDVIIHSAALTEWGQPTEHYDAINVAGTERVVELAARAGAPVVLMSTAFVRALEIAPPGTLRPDNMVLPYITSKLASEAVVRASGLPHAIVRPTNLVGDSQTGAAVRPQIVQTLSDWIRRGKAPYFPMHPGNLIDVAPVDVLADATRAVVEAAAYDGGITWIAYGAPAMTVPETLEIIAEHAARIGRELRIPPIVDPRGPLPVPLDAVPTFSRRFLRVLTDVSEVTHASGGVLPTSLPGLAHRYGIALPSDRESYSRSLEYWAAQRGAAAVGATKEAL